MNQTAETPDDYVVRDFVQQLIWLPPLVHDAPDLPIHDISCHLDSIPESREDVAAIYAEREGPSEEEVENEFFKTEWTADTVLEMAENLPSLNPILSEFTLTLLTEELEGTAYGAQLKELRKWVEDAAVSLRCKHKLHDEDTNRKCVKIILFGAKDEKYAPFKFNLWYYIDGTIRGTLDINPLCHNYSDLPARNRLFEGDLTQLDISDVAAEMTAAMPYVTRQVRELVNAGISDQRARVAALSGESLDDDDIATCIGIDDPASVRSYRSRYRTETSNARDQFILASRGYARVLTKGGGGKHPESGDTTVSTYILEHPEIDEPFTKRAEYIEVIDVVQIMDYEYDHFDFNVNRYGTLPEFIENRYLRPFVYGNFEELQTQRAPGRNDPLWWEYTGRQMRALILDIPAAYRKELGVSDIPVPSQLEDQRITRHPQLHEED